LRLSNGPRYGPRNRALPTRSVPPPALRFQQSGQGRATRKPTSGPTERCVDAKSLRARRPPGRNCAWAICQPGPAACPPMQESALRLGEATAPRAGRLAALPATGRGTSRRKLPPAITQRHLHCQPGVSDATDDAPALVLRPFPRALVVAIRPRENLGDGEHEAKACNVLKSPPLGHTRIFGGAMLNGVNIRFNWVTRRRVEVPPYLPGGGPTGANRPARPRPENVGR